MPGYQATQVLQLALHPEGVEVLKGFGIAALALLFLALRFSSWPGDLFAPFWVWVMRDFPPPSPNYVAKPDKRTLRKQDRRVREQIRQTFHATNRRMRREQSRKRLIAFDCFAVIIAAYLLADWLFIPEPYRLHEQRWPIAISVFLAGALVIFVGTQVWEERVGWKKWSFWLSLLATSVGVLWLTKLLPPRGPWGAIFNLVAGGFFFLWMFGQFRRIDRNRLQQEQLVSGSSAGDPLGRPTSRQ